MDEKHPLVGNNGQVANMGVGWDIFRLHVGALLTQHKKGKGSIFNVRGNCGSVNISLCFGCLVFNTIGACNALCAISCCVKDLRTM